MKRYDFDRVIDRRNTDCLKYDFAEKMGLPEDVLPLWIADMDFPAPPCVIDALKKLTEFGVYGYTDAKEDYALQAAEWFSRRFGWRPEAKWLVRTPGVVYALSAAVCALTEPGEAVLVQPPVYYPFFKVIRENGRKLVESPLVYENGKYSIDFRDFQEKIRENNVKMFILCSPHNPVCRVWTEEELQTIGRICKEHGVFVVSDEIHCDFVLPGHRHEIFCQANPDMSDQCLICTAPSKTFNLAGLETSNIWIPNGEVRKRFGAELNRRGASGPNMMGLAARKAASAQGEEWLEELKVSLQGNLDFLRSYLRENLPEIRLVEPEGTYFAWLDCSALGLSPEELNQIVIHKARLWLDEGAIFGGNGGQFQRMVLACPRATLEEALKRLKQGVESL